eukprot:6455231-Amphidinium_carterae.2
MPFLRVACDMLLGYSNQSRALHGNGDLGGHLDLVDVVGNGGCEQVVGVFVCCCGKNVGDGFAGLEACQELRHLLDIFWWCRGWDLCERLWLGVVSGWHGQKWLTVLDGAFEMLCPMLPPKVCDFICIVGDSAAGCPELSGTVWPVLVEAPCLIVSIQWSLSFLTWRRMVRSMLRSSVCRSCTAAVRLRSDP